MILVNPSGRVVKCNEYAYNYYKNKKGWKVVEEAQASSTDFTISELREMKSTIEDWDSFIDGDNRKSIHSL